MNNTIKLAVASALLAAASTASAAGGIVAGDWTLDIGGVVNAYYTSTKQSGTSGGAGYGGLFNTVNSTGTSTANNITTGLLPNYLSVSGKTRQNDLDVTFLISIQPGASTTAGGIQSFNNGNGARQENRQAFLTFGDASWGSVKLGKDIGVFASDAILNDMTLLGVGSGAGGLAGNDTTTGRIGTGFMYADWKSQIAYTSPNFNGLSFTAAVTQAWNVQNTIIGATSTGRGGKEPAFEGKASYAFNADPVAGKVWVSGISQKVEGLTNGAATPVALTGAGASDRATAVDFGANVSAAGFGLTGYYYTGHGIGQTIQLNSGFDTAGNDRKSDGYYVQGTYTLPGVATKLGVSYGESKLKGTSSETLLQDITDSMWTVGAYHPLTKHLNLVAEYSEAKHEYDVKTVGVANTSSKGKTVALGAILFF
ncbi:OmpC Outer membrane protein (porin) [Methylophilaceae bacterium]